ncbi:Wzz/FepE/Etk N-terminal domain-containing protein [Cupriavidus basilensis]|nr:Wzz/FepE/Etk N-terminal domain-containing protein [Cupriavidus basilensis]
MPVTSPTTSDTQYLSLTSFVAKYFKLLVVSVIVGALVAVGFSFIQHPRWTAKMTVQIGQVAGVGSAVPGVGAAPTNLIESQMTTVERYGLSSFKFDVLKVMGLPLPNRQNPDSDLIFDSLRAAPSKSLDLINVQASGYSPEMATQTLRVAFNELRREHDKAFNPTIDRMKAELKDTSDKLVAMEKEYDSVYGSLKRTSDQAKAQAAPHDVFLANVVATISVESRALNQRKAQLEEALASLRTYPTRVLGDVYVADRPSTPGKLLYSAGGALIGLIAGILIALFLNLRRR